MKLTIEDKDKANEEWVGMPEFEQVKKEPFSKIVVRFETEDDLKEFSELIGQKLTQKTKSIWHPHKPHRRSTNNYYTYEPSKS